MIQTREMMPQIKPMAPIATPTPMPALAPVDRPLLLEAAIVVGLVVADEPEPVTVTVETPSDDEVLEEAEMEVAVDLDVVEVDTTIFAAAMSESGEAPSKVSDVGLSQSVAPS